MVTHKRKLGVDHPDSRHAELWPGQQAAMFSKLATPAFMGSLLNYTLPMQMLAGSGS